MLSAIIAASMSTADSQLLVASSSFTSDIYKPIIRKEASDKELLWVGRIVVVIVSVVAYIIASSKGEGASRIIDLVSNAWGALRAQRSARSFYFRFSGSASPIRALSPESLPVLRLTFCGSSFSHRQDFMR